MKGSSLAKFFRPVLAFFLPLAAFILQWIFWPYIQPFVWFLFYPAAFFSAWIDGLRGAIAGTVLSAMLVVYFFMPPQFNFVLDNPVGYLSVGIFITMGCLFGYTQELLRKANSLLEERVIRRTAQLDMANSLLKDEINERKKGEAEIRSLNSNLDSRVKERTAQLEEVNKELEAFSYSVSHDLRAPLRHINGYIDLLKSRFPDALPEKGKHYIDTIADSANHMGLLIDDLLKFSRTSRQEMQLITFDMNDVLKNVIGIIKEYNSERKIEWITETLPEVYGDYNLIKMVWFNLLNNAVKFTRIKEKATINIGFEETDKEFVFHVIDNGTGFDMQYAGKLFGVFQRLHSNEEYEGTGIGLANAHRIILRHGGRIWADAEPDNGAIFYFSLLKVKEEKDHGKFKDNSPR